MTHERSSEERITIDIPLVLRKRGGRKLVVVPAGAGPWAPSKPRLDNSLIKAVARAFRWKAMLESGEYTSVQDIAAAEKITHSYVSRILRFAYLAPDIIEAIVEGKQSPAVWQDKMRGELPESWAAQRRLLLAD
jgi:hypothetical protein